MSDFIKSFLFLVFLTDVLLASQGSKTASILWQKEFSYNKYITTPILMEFKNHKLVVVGVYRPKEREQYGRVWQWVLDSKTGNRIKDITLERVKRKNSRFLIPGWVSKGLIVNDINDIQLLNDDGHKLIRYKNGHTVQKNRLKAKDSSENIFARGMKRFDSNAYFLFGRGEAGAILQKRENNGDGLIWEKQYGKNGLFVTDIDCFKSGDKFAIVGISRSQAGDQKEDLNSIWIKIIDNDGVLLAQKNIKIPFVDILKTPEVAVLSDNRIALIYNSPNKGKISDIKYRVYTSDLELQCEKNIAESKQDFLSYSMKSIHEGFVVVYEYISSGLYNSMLKYYDAEGTQVTAIKLDGLASAPGNQILLNINDNMVYLALMRTPVRPLTQIVITAIKLSDNGKVSK